MRYPINSSSTYSNWFNNDRSKDFDDFRLDGIEDRSFIAQIKAIRSKDKSLKTHSIVIKRQLLKMIDSDIYKESFNDLDNPANLLIKSEDLANLPLIE